MAITAGTYSAKVDGEVVLGASKNKGTPFIEFYLKILEGPNQGGYCRWTGYFPDSNADVSNRSIQSLQLCGWQGDDLSEFSDGGLHGLDTNEVSIVVDIEEYQNEQGETRHSPRVQWINRKGGFLNKEAAMNEGAAAAFGARMRGLVLKSKEKNPQPTAKAKAVDPRRDPAPSHVDDSNDPDAIPF